VSDYPSERIAERLDHITRLVHDINPGRSRANLGRRALKLLEELGEVSEAWLNVTSGFNGKDKSWDDVREEVADCLVVALDIHLTNDGVEPAPVHFDVRVGDPESFVPMTFLVASHLSNCGTKFFEGDDRAVTFYAAQAAIAAVDLAFIPFPGHTPSLDEMADELTALVERKLAKWAANQERARQAASASD